MQQRRLGPTLSVPALGLGCMGMSEFYGATDDAESMRTLHRAMELGVTFLDTADVYGPHRNEELLGRFLKGTDAAPTIATKFGIVREPGSYARTISNEPAYVRSSCEASLGRLGVERIDLYYVHRVERERPIEEVMIELGRLVDEGKVAHVGLCEVGAETLRRAHAVTPVAAVQSEYSLWTRDVEAEVLPACRELGVGLVPYSPLGRGFLTGRVSADSVAVEGDFRASLPRFSKDAFDVNARILGALERMAADRGCEPAQLALAWLLAQGQDLVPIPGTRRTRWLEQNAAAAELPFTADDERALREAFEAGQVVGERYTPEGMKGVEA